MSGGAAIIGSGAILGIGNYTNSMMLSGGDFSFAEFLKSGIIGSVSAAMGAVVGAAISPLTNKIGSGISNKIISRAVSNAVGGAVTGGALGAAFSFNDPNTSWWQGALNGMRDGALAGAVSGAAQGYYEYRLERATQIKQNALNTQKEKTIQKHHFATNKNKEFTPQMEKIAKKYGLNLWLSCNSPWMN